MTGTYAGQFVMEVKDGDAGSQPHWGTGGNTGVPWVRGAAPPHKVFGSINCPPFLQGGGAWGIAHGVGGRLLAPGSIVPRRWGQCSLIAMHGHAHPL